jgi:hypothetical protein
MEDDIYEIYLRGYFKSFWKEMMVVKSKINDNLFDRLKATEAENWKLKCLLNEAKGRIKIQNSNKRRLMEEAGGPAELFPRGVPYWAKIDSDDESSSDEEPAMKQRRLARERMQRLRDSREDVTYDCPRCDKSFKRKDSCARHFRTFHE